MAWTTLAAVAARPAMTTQGPPQRSARRGHGCCCGPTRRLLRPRRSLRRRGLGGARPENDPLGIAVEVADRAAELGDRAPRIDRQCLVLAQSIAREAGQADRDLRGALVEIFREGANRPGGLQQLVLDLAAGEILQTRH